MNKYDIDETQKSSILQATGGTNQALEALRKIMADKRITPQSQNFRNSVTALLSTNSDFREFMLKGANITEKEYEDNKTNILDPSNEQGQKMLQFLSYAVSNNLSQGSRAPNQVEMTEFLTKNMKDTTIQATSPLYI